MRIGEVTGVAMGAQGGHAPPPPLIGELKKKKGEPTSNNDI